MHGVCGNGDEDEPIVGGFAKMIVTDRAEKFVPGGHRLFTGGAATQRPEIRTPATRLRLDDSLLLDGASVNEGDEALVRISSLSGNCFEID